MASQGHSAELDSTFIMALEMVRLFLCLFKLYEGVTCDKCVCTEGYLELAFSHLTLLCWCKGSIGQFV